MDNQAEIFLKVTEHRSRIMATIVAMTRDFQLSEDLFQETVIEVIKSSENFDSNRDFAPWACGIARNIVRRHWKRQEKQSSLITQEALEVLAEIATENDEPDVWQEERLALHKCMNKVPDKMRKLLVLRYGQNYKGDELAKRSGIKVGSLRTTLLRLRKKLSECISGEVGDQVELGC